MNVKGGLTRLTKASSFKNNRSAFDTNVLEEYYLLLSVSH